MAEFKTDSSWYDESGKIKYENILDLINAYVVAGVTKDEDIRLKVGPTVWQDYQDILSKRSENNRSKKTNDNINYGKKGERVEEIAKALYTDKKYGSKVEDLARKLKDGKVFDSDKTEYGNYRIEMNSNTARALGEFLADNQEGLRKVVLTDDNGNIKFTSKNKIFSEFDDNDLYKINTSYGERVKYNEDSKAINDYMSGVQDRIGYGDNDIKNKINNLEKDGIFEKLKQGKTLTEDEVKRFNEVKNEYLDTKKGLEDIAKQRGIDLNGKSIFGLPEQKTAKNKKTGEEYRYWDFSENSKITEMSFSSPVYNSFSRAQQLGIEKYDVNADGTFKAVNAETGKVENPNEKLLKDVDNSNDFKTISNDYKGKIEKELENDFQRDVVQNSNITNPDYINMKRDYYYEENVGRYTDKILESDNKAFYGDKNAENLYKLKQRGVKLTTEENKILQDYAIAYQGGIKDTDDVITNLKKASSNAFNGYDINTNNIDYINAGEGFKLEYKNKELTIDESSLDDDVKNSKEYMDNYKGKVIDRETDLSSLARMNATAKRKRNIGGDTSYDDFLKDAEKEISEMKDAESGFGLNRREQLEKMGMSSDNAKKLDEAMKDGSSLNKDSLLDAIEDYKNNRNKKLSVGEIEFDGLSQKQLQEILQKNGIGNLSGLSEKELRDKAADLFDIKNTNGRLGTGMKYHMTGRKIDSAQAVKDFYNDIIDGGEINLEKLKGVFSVENKNQIGTLGELVKESMSGKSIDEIARDKKRDSALGTVYDAIIGAMDKYGDGLSSEEKDKVNKLAKKFKDRKFSEDELKKLDGIIDDVSDFKEKFESIKGSGFASKAKDVLRNKTFKGVAGVAAAIGGIGLVANAVSKASEERERKRQEMNQLIAMQSSSLRGGY